MYAAGRTPYEVGLRGRTEDFLIEDGFEKLALPLRNEVGGSGRAPFFTKDSRVYITRLSFKATNVKLCKKV